VVPSEDYSHWPPAVAALFGEKAKSPKQIKNGSVAEFVGNPTENGGLAAEEKMSFSL
jgi:hypothetical protein